jgi:hypothetical protein
MDSHLSYDEQMADVRSAQPYASPRDQQFLAGVHQRMARDKHRSAEREEAEKRKRRASLASSSPSYGGGSGSWGSSGSSSGSSSYSGPSAWDKAVQSNQNRAFDDWARRAASGRQQLPSNPYNR